MENLRSFLIRHINKLLFLVFTLLMFVIFSIALSACAPPPDTGGVPLVAFSTLEAPETIVEPEGSGSLDLIDCQERICVYRIKVGAGYLTCVVAIHTPFSGQATFDLECG